MGIDKALSKMTKKEKKKEAKMMAAQKKKLLVPKHIPYKFQPIDIPKERPKWLPLWMWQEFKHQNEAHLDEEKKHAMIKVKIEKEHKKEKALEHAVIAHDYKKFKKAKQNAKKEIKKALKQEIKKEKKMEEKHKKMKVAAKKKKLEMKKKKYTKAKEKLVKEAHDKKKEIAK